MFVLNLFLLALNFALILYAINFFPFTFSLLQYLWAWHSLARHMTVFNKNLTISATGLEKGQTKSIISTAFLVLGYKITHIVVSVQNVLCHCITAFTNNNSLILTIPLTLQVLGVISIKCLLVISMLCKTEWSWELQILSHKMNLLDILSTSPHYFCRKWIGATNRNSNFDLSV